MKAAALLDVGWDGQRAFARRIDAPAPWSIRHAGDRFLIVSSAAAPVGGDELELTIDLVPGATACIGTVAATIAWPGAATAPPSQTITRLRVGAGAHLVWAPEPTVSVARSRHVTRTFVELAAGSTCEIVEEYALGRHAEPCGTLDTELRVTRAGAPLVHHRERFTPGGPRHVVAAVSVGGTAAPFVHVEPDLGLYAARFPGAQPGVTLVLAAAPDRPAALRAAAGPDGCQTAIAARTSSSESPPP